jgi:1,2-diacylglycerol 3-beta-glucosyltransferase
MLRLSLDILLLTASVPVLIASAYLGLLALASRRRVPPSYGPPRLRFDVVVPAHDEEAGIGATVRSLLGVNYPLALFRVIVVADNCTDRTAARAGAAGATVLERHDLLQPGKGHALSYAFAYCLGHGAAAAVVVVDADSTVSPNLLLALQARLATGALAVQTNNVVANPGLSWRTRLMAIAFALFNTVRSLGRERLGCSVGLRGNGMCLSVKLLRQVPHEAFSIVEDLEYGIRVGLAGHRVHLAAEATVSSEMVQSAAASRSQRVRWEVGRKVLAHEYRVLLIRRGLASHDRVLLDLGLDLAVPPLVSVMASALAGGMVTFVASWITGTMLVAAWTWSGAIVALAAYVVRGWWVSGTGYKGLSGLMYAPAYAVWKLGLALDQGMPKPHGWVRTAREGTELIASGGSRPAPFRST